MRPRSSAEYAQVRLLVIVGVGVGHLPLGDRLPVAAGITDLRCSSETEIAHSEEEMREIVQHDKNDKLTFIQ